MRKVTFGGANSLDNFFARKDDSVDWLLWCKEVQQLMKDYWKNIDPYDGEGQFCDKGESYKSFIFARDDEQKKLAEASREKLVKELEKLTKF